MRQVEGAETVNSRARDEMSACEGAPIDAELCSEITSPLELFEVTSMFDSEDEEPSAEEISSTADPVEADSLSG